MWHFKKKRTIMRFRLICTIIFLFGFIIILDAQVNPKPKIKCDYLLYLPIDYKTNNDLFPLIIYLHGGSQRGNDLNKLKTYGLPYLIDKGVNYDFIIASPQCPDNTLWSRIDWFDSLYLDLTTKYRIDKQRIFVTGISIGGFGTWQVAMDYPDKIAAIIPLCGGCNDSVDICRINKLPIWTFHGTADSMININETERLVNRLQKCNGNIKFSRLENAGHGIQDIYQKPEIFEWLKKQKK
jgi:predicted peptidase